MPFSLSPETSLTGGISVCGTPTLVCLDRVRSAHADRGMRSAHLTDFVARSRTARVTSQGTPALGKRTADQEFFDLDRRDTRPRLLAHLTAPSGNDPHLDTNGNPLRPFDD